MAIPNLLIIGAAKAGTTSLHHYLNQHPQIYMSPVKEPNFFALEGQQVNFQGIGDNLVINRHSITDWQQYQDHFQPNRGETVIGDASTLYLSSPTAASRIYHYVPQAKIIAMLRHPIDRAYSNFLHARRDDREPIHDFLQALEIEERRIEDNWGPLWHYKSRGFYYNQLSPYFQRFTSTQIKIYLYEDFIKKPQAILQDIFSFLNVDPTFVPDTSIQFNASGIPKNRTWHRFLSQRNPIISPIVAIIPYKIRKQLLVMMQKQNMEKPLLSVDERKRLSQLYKSDVIQLQALLQRDLTHWLT
ncbi:sulfotransferase [Anaerolineales bacterium HSG25]|nr:sulfotransferase [Anaerolineales bacterium HSG25]